MKNSTKKLSVLILSILMYAFLEVSSAKTVFKTINFTIRNDLNESIQLDTGKATIILDVGAAYKLNKESGNKIYLVEKGEKTKLLLRVKISDEGKVFNLSKLINP